MRRRSLLALVATVLLVDTAFDSAITPLVPYYTHHLGFSSAVDGALVAAYPAGLLLFAIPSGLLSARRGARSALLLGVLLTGAATVVFGLATSPPLLLGARLVQGAGGACSWAGGLAWLAVTTPQPRRAEAFGWGYGAAAIGALVGPLIGGLATAAGTPAVFSCAGAVALVLGGFALSTPAAEPEGRDDVRSLPVLWRDRGIATGLWLCALAGLGEGMVSVLAPLRLSALGTGSGMVAVAFFAAAALSAAASPRVGRAVDRRGYAAPLRLALAGCAVTSVLAATVVPWQALAAVVALGTPAFVLVYTPSTALVSRGADRRGISQGMIAASLNIVWSVGAATGSAGGGAVAGVAGQLLAYLVLAACCGLGVLALGARAARRGAGPVPPEV